MPAIYERRTFLEPIEFRGEKNGRRMVAAGVAIRYNAISKDLGGFVERALPGCAKKTIAERDIVALRNHEPDALLGRTSAGTLRLFNSPEELRFEVDLADNTVGRDTAVMLERRDLIGSSFGFRNVVRPTWEKRDDGSMLRSLHEISIRDVGPVTFNAYDAATSELALRDLADETGIELRSLVQAADAGTLAAVIDGKVERRSDALAAILSNIADLASQAAALYAAEEAEDEAEDLADDQEDQTGCGPMDMGPSDRSEGGRETTANRPRLIGTWAY